MSRRLRVAVVGLGIGREHVAAYAKLPELFEIAAVCDLDPARAEDVASRFGVKTVLARFADVLTLDRLDIVDICTPPSTHLALAEQALAAGCHVVCEKPLVGSLADCDRLAAAEMAAGRRVMPMFQYRFGNGLQKLKHLQATGLCGTPYLSTIETSWRRDADYYEVSWRGKWASELGGCCLTQAIHAHDLLSYVNGPVASVFARLKTRVNPIEVEDCAAIAVELTNGSLATLAVTLGAAEELSRLRFMFADLTVESASVEPYAPGKDPWHFKGRNAGMEKRIAAALADFTPTRESFEGQFARMHAALTTAKPLPVTIADARASLELITAIYHSAETGQPVALPIASDHPKYAAWTPAGLGFNRD